MMKVALAASALLIAGIGTATAASVPQSGISATTPVVEVQHRRDHHRAHRRGPPPRWVAGRRYDRSPPGWRRHGKRPHDWRRRGCVVVGPVWFCP